MHPRRISKWFSMIAGLCALAPAAAPADCVMNLNADGYSGQIGLNYSGPTGAMGSQTITIANGLSGTEKATLVANALVSDPIFGGNVSQSANNVYFAGAPIFDVTDSTGELNCLGQAGPIFPGGSSELAKSVQVGFTGTVTGADASGAIATYFAEIKFGNVDDQFTMTYTPGMTLASLQLAMFAGLDAGLAANLRGNLSLNAATGRITFIEPANIFNAVVCDQSTDVGIVTGLNLTVVPVVPEPTSLMMTGTAALSGVGFWLRRRSNPADRR